jgi:very-short-patch-repair endonuclease
MRRGEKSRQARQLRRNMTIAERRLWSILRMRGIEGFRFRRQCPLGPYIVDFACLEARLVVEADGGQHMDSTTDTARDARLCDMGFRVLRFWNHDIVANLEGVRAAIAEHLAQRCPHPPFGHLPPQAGEENKSRGTFPRKRDDSLPRKRDCPRSDET